MRSALLSMVLIGSIAACGSKKDAPAKTAPAAVQDAAEPPPPPLDAPARTSTRSGPWSIDAIKVTTTDKLASAGFKVVHDADASREPGLRGASVDTDDDHAVGLIAFTSRDGSAPGAGQIAWLETSSGAAAAPFEAAGLCVEGVCPGAPAADAVKLGLKTCDTNRIEMEFRFSCPVAGTPLLVIVEGDVPDAAHGGEMAFAEIVAAKRPIHSLAWETEPGMWQPMMGCITDCD